MHFSRAPQPTKRNRSFPRQFDENDIPSSLLIEPSRLSIEGGLLRNWIQVLAFLLFGISNISAAASPQTDSARVEKLFDNYLREYLKLNPEEASQLGLPKAGGYEFDRGGFDDGSDGGIKANLDLAEKYLKEFGSIDISKAAKSQIVDIKILIWLLKLQIEGRAFVDDAYAIDHLTGAFPKALNLMTEYHTIDNLQDARDYLRRLDQLPKRLLDAADRVRAQEKKAIRPSVFIIDRVIVDLDGFVKAEPSANLLYADFKDKLAAVKSIDPTTTEQMCKEAATTIGQKIYPACNTLKAACTESRLHADSTPGVWRLPDGDKYYQYSLKSYTSSSLPPQQTFDLGIQEVKRLQSKARILLDSMGIKGDTTFGELMQEYWSMQEKPELLDKFQYRDGPERNQMILNDYRAIVDKTWARLPQLFAYIPKMPVSVEPVPEYKQAGGLTYYEPASLDGRRKATFYINMSHALAKPSMNSLTYHETIPGHHFQIATQQELTQNRLFKNLFFLSGYGEGWAMYCEDLAAEQGWLPDIYARLAEINSQLFRAVRIVVDAGIHQQRWTRVRALTYMADNLGWGSENEIDRYSIWPGQACAYTVGKLRIMAMRENAKRVLGSKFDLKDFHMAVLRNGSIPLDLLEEIVADYAKGGK
jgi:uncharacterized protein (DUF885 family)